MRTFYTLLIAGLLGLVVTIAQADNQYIEFGTPGLCLDQPRVAIEIYQTDPLKSFGPTYFNTFLLDTGAQGILLAQYAYAEVLEEGYTTVCDFNELGVGGTVSYRVSEVYNLDYAGSDGARNTLSDVRLLSSSTADFYGFAGIVGMPAMLNKVTSLNNSPMAELSYIEVGFSQTLPASNGNRYSVPLSFFDFPASSGQVNPGDPLPTYAPLPSLQAQVGHNGLVDTGDFIVDTGSQMSMISSAMAMNLGLDANGDGIFSGDEIVGEIPLSGVGGTHYAPVVLIEKLSLTTAEGIDLVWTNLQMPILDIDPSIDGIFGSDILNSGWVDGLFTGELGHILDVHFDFLDYETTANYMVLDLNPDFNVVVPEPATAGLVLIGGLALLSMRRRRKPKAKTK